MTKFVGIPNRDATASIRGYVYQIYQSVLAWMLLGENEVLVLEGAEDFDVQSGLSIVTTQVKHQSGNVTLRSSAVVDAINNFWIHQRSNTDFQVTLRFLSTAEAGCEQGAPFGSDRCGLEYWRSTAHGATDGESLRQFFLTLPLDEALLEFIRSASAVALCDRLLARIQWDLGSKDTAALQYVIENKLKVHGAKRGINTHYSTHALPHLLKRVADLLTKDGLKQLYYGDFLSAFDEATSEVIPRGALDAMQNSGAMQLTFRMQEAGEIARLAAMPPSLGTPLPRVRGAIGRANLVSRIAALLKSTKTVFLYGSSGVGKTNLASLVTEEIGGAWLWAGFRGRSPEQVREGLTRATYEIESVDDPILMVLDDVELGRISQFEREFVALIFAVAQRDGLVLITGIARPPLQLFPKLWLTTDCEVPVPYFDESEVNHLLLEHGLSDSRLREGWARVIFLSTYGHPQLVHARVRTLSAQGWPPVTLSDLTGSEDITRVRQEARQRLLEQFPSDATRTLAYRLSVIIGSFSRQTVIAVANAPQAIPLAGEAFDHLVGPWIEREDENRFRVSPLLGGAAETVLPPGEIKAVHVAIAQNYLGRRTLNQYELATAFFHAFMAKDLATLAAIANGIVLEDGEHIGLLYDAMTWFPHLALEAGQRIVEENPNVDLLLRLAQFRFVTSSVNTENALKIVDRLEELLAAMEDSSLKKMSEAMVYGVVLNTIDIHIPSQTVVRMLSCLIDTATTPDLKDIYANLGRNRPPGMPRIGSDRPEQLLFSYQAVRLSGLDDLEALVASLDELPKDKRDLLLGVCDSDICFASLLIGNAWWSDVKDGLLDVGKALTVLKTVELTSRCWGANEIVQACQVATSVIHDEYGNSAENALAVLDKAEAEFPNIANLVNQRAKVLFHAKRELDAIPIAGKALSLPGLSNVEYVYTCRHAGIAAANLGNWARATEFFETGSQRALKSTVQKPMGIGLMADAAFGYWKQGKQQQSISRFANTLELLEPVPVTDDIKLRNLHATVRHCVTWIHLEAVKERSEHIAEPRPGMCSNQEPHEGIKSHRIVAISGAWALLRSTEQALGLDCGIRTHADKFSEAEQPLFVAGYQRTVAFEAALKTPPWDGLVSAYVRMHEAMHYSKALRIEEREEDGWQLGEIPPLPEDYWRKPGNWGLTYQIFLAACVNCLARHPDQSFPVEQWRADLSTLAPLPSEVAQFLDVLEGCSADESLCQKLGAGLVALHHGPVSADELWKISFRLLNALEPVKRWIELDAETLAIRKWLFAVDNQQFAFAAPRMAIPAIKASCVDNSLNGLAKVATVLSIAAPYLSIRMSVEARAMLTKIAATPTGDSTVRSPQNC
ncbi:tetratricopeptide repeat protein [Quatrionicoccus australiensis]|uniref:tetratricopeptide repeat protein n=1 Tax=Quatrionicoccus australiensis TaxID=138118 RepID=UPI001CFC1DBC|nr:ATP-binding protein [Quatrionicoccus australiensis]MCB4358527.1 ATP-binding protein [Quatrionicoccus australiensis]